MLADSIEKFKIKNELKDYLVAFIFIWYFCHEIVLSVWFRILGEKELFSLFYNLIFFGSIGLYILTHSTKKIWYSIICYSVITLLFAFTILVHPEYESWYFEETFGIQQHFFHGFGGIWAFLVISLATEKEELLRYIKIVAWLLFIYLSLRFMVAQNRGYWEGHDGAEEAYSLGFGYSILFPVVYFAAEAFLNNEKYYYLPFIIGVILILLGGSRGAILWAMMTFPVMITFKWKDMTRKKKIFIMLSVLLLLPTLLLIFSYLEQIVHGAIAILGKFGITSRTLAAMISGEIADANGRDQIYLVTIDRISEGGFLGNGVFGERTAVGRWWRWGYAHNFFLEIFAAFGYIGGTVISLFLVSNIIRTAKCCCTKEEQIIFTTFFCSSLKLLLSDSFWFNSSFWALLAIIILWRKKSVKKKCSYSNI